MFKEGGHSPNQEHGWVLYEPVPESYQNAQRVILGGIEDVWNKLERLGSKFYDNKDRPWRRPEELNRVITLAQEDAQNLFDALRPLKEGTGDKQIDNLVENFIPTLKWKQGERSWHWAAVRAMIVPWAERGHQGKIDPESTIWGMELADRMERYIWVHIMNQELLAGWDHPRTSASEALDWEAVKQISGLEKNPYLYRTLLLAWGAVASGFYRVGAQAENLSEMLVVDFPLTLEDGKLALGCIGFGDGKAGDSEVCYVHEIWESCEKARPASPSIPQRVIGSEKQTPPMEL